MTTLHWSSRRSDFVALLFSGVAAALAPLPVFLLAFLILGPFHYLTEILWLHKKSFYFHEGVIAPKWYALAAGLLALAVVFNRVENGKGGIWVIVIAIVLSISVLVRKRALLAAIALAAVAITVLAPSIALFVGAVLPSLVHVFVFTWVFMVSGAMRSTSTRYKQWVNPALLLAIPLLLLALPMHYGAQGAVWIRIEHVSFEQLHWYAARHLHRPWLMNGALLDDPVVAAIFRIFAFTYTFHYLNWFGKAELLEWHRIPARSWVAIAALYALAMGLLVWNFFIGFLAVNFLSLLHVLLEFPLDWQAVRFVLHRRRSLPQPAQIAVGS